MAEILEQLTGTYNLFAKTTEVFQKRAKIGQDRFSDRAGKALNRQAAQLAAKPMSLWQMGSNWLAYSVDYAQRWILFWDTLRRRGNIFVEHEQADKPPVLHFEYEMVLDARHFDQPVNYALVRIVPPAGVTVDPKRRPYVMIDPRAGHGPGIGGFKDDSQVGVALRDGHPVYFIIFYPTPEPGQTLLDVCVAEQKFVHHVRHLHPDSPKPVIVGNCQGGWAAMMLAASGPEDTGPIVINGAPMSYWGGAWSEGPGDNPMRYAGGMLGGSWISSLTADMGNGLFDGAFLVQNFEYLNPANTYWDKYYRLFSKIDTEPPRFLDFERWWGGFYLLSREEIEWIVQNLFIGNKLWSGEVRTRGGKFFDLREIRSPIILFASLGDNITPPQQAFNWVADVYGSTEEIKSHGQVIVGLLHRDIGHLGIFVSGRVAKKEHKQIVSVLKSIEALPPGLYGMQIEPVASKNGKADYQVSFVEHRLEDIIPRLNPYKRVDEKAFEAVVELSEFNQKAYELFARPWVQAMANDVTARLARGFNPIRFQRWVFSDLNPWMRWLDPAAGMVKNMRRPAEPDHPLRQTEQMLSELISASLDYYRGMRDAITEMLFFQIFGSMYLAYLAGKDGDRAGEAKAPADPRDLPFVKDALASIAEGGYAEAISRTGYLLERKGRPLPLSRLHIRHELMAQYRDLLPALPPDQRRRIRGEQEIICRYEPEKAIATLPKLLSDSNDRRRFHQLLDCLLADPRFIPEDVTQEQIAMLERIRGVLPV